VPALTSVPCTFALSVALPALATVEVLGAGSIQIPGPLVHTLASVPITSARTLTAGCVAGCVPTSQGLRRVRGRDQNTVYRGRSTMAGDLGEVFTVREPGPTAGTAATWAARAPRMDRMV
jgi:hypothetical protein